MPHELLVTQAQKYQYSLLILRLSIAAYRLPRTVSVAAVCSKLVTAARGITAGAVHATIELRLLLIQPRDHAKRAFPMASISAYVDDVTIEAIGTERLARRATVGATKVFSTDLISMGMEVSGTKNVCSSSDPGMAQCAVREVQHLMVKISKRAKALGLGLGAGVVRNASVARARLSTFRARRGRFRGLRRCGGNVALVLRTGGAAGLTYSPEAMGVSTSTLLRQRRAVGAALVQAGSGDRDIRLILAELGSKGKVDPAFPAHCGPIVAWATAVWEGWLPMPTLQALFRLGSKLHGLSTSPWARVRGLGTAVVATTDRLGWHMDSPTSIRTHQGQVLELQRDSPAFVKAVVVEGVERWRWMQVEARMPTLADDLALEAAAVPALQRSQAQHQRVHGMGAFVQPLACLFRPSRKAPRDWTRQHAGALRSAMADRQWTQVRHHKVGHDVEGPNWLLCVNAGRCTQSSRDPRFLGTLVHRIFTCPSLEPLRNKHMPEWLRQLVHSHLRDDYTLPPELVLFLTRALVSHPRGLATAACAGCHLCLGGPAD